MMRNYLRCHAADCRHLFAVDSDAASALLEAALARSGLKLTCPVCRLTYLYRSDEVRMDPDPYDHDRLRAVRNGPLLVLA